MLRAEAFGSLLYDRANVDYIPFDEQATQIFRLAAVAPLDRVYAQLPAGVAHESFDTFAKLCASIGILDSWGRFTGVFLDPSPAIPGLLSAPTMVHLACTKACNFQCRHCFSASGSPYPDELTTTEITGLIDQMAGLGCFRLILGGGEPLARHDLVQLIRHANQRGVAVEISTNAVAASPAVVNGLQGLQVAAFNVSLEGATAAVYDGIRGQTGAFPQALDGIARLKTLGAPVRLRHLLMAPNAGTLPALAALAAGLGVAEIQLRTLMPTGRAAVAPDLLLGWQAVNQAWAQAAAIATPEIRIDQLVPGHRKRAFAGFGCECGHLHCYVDPRGEVSPSGLLKDRVRAGSLRRQSLKEIWDGAGFAPMRGGAGNTACRHCTEFGGCRGGCRASALLVDGGITLPDANCPLTHGAPAPAPATA